MNCSGLLTSSARLSACSAAPEAPSRTLIWSERGERDAEAVAGCPILLQRHAAFRELQRLVVAVLHHRDVRWLPQMVATTSPARTIIASRSACRSAAIASSRRPSCAWVTAQRVHERQIAAIARGVQCGGGCAMCSRHDRRVADVRYRVRARSG